MPAAPPKHATYAIMDLDAAGWVGLTAFLQDESRNPGRRIAMTGEAMDISDRGAFIPWHRNNGAIVRSVNVHVPDDLPASAVSDMFRACGDGVVVVVKPLE